MENMKANYISLSTSVKIILSTLLVSAALIFTPTPTYASSKEVVKVKLGQITSVGTFADTFDLKLASSTLTVTYSDTTYIYDGEENVVSLEEAIKKGQTVYVFGILDENNENMKVEKIIVKNPSKLSRKNLVAEASVGALSQEQKEQETFSLWLEIWKGITFTTVYGAERIENGFGYLQASSSLEKLSKSTYKDTKKEGSLQTISQYVD